MTGHHRTGECCRLLVGMQRAREELLPRVINPTEDPFSIDMQTAQRLKKQMAEEFRNQLTIGFPTARDEAALRALAVQLHARKVVVKLFLRQHLHAKLYLCYRSADPDNPIKG